MDAAGVPFCPMVYFVPVVYGGIWVVGPALGSLQAYGFHAGLAAATDRPFTVSKYPWVMFDGAAMSIDTWTLKAFALVSPNILPQARGIPLR